MTTNGIIDNDKVSIPGQLPFFLKESFEGVILKGTPVVQIMTHHVDCTPEDTSTWGTDDMVFVDTVLAKAGLTRDTEWVQPEPTPVTPPADPTPAPELP